MNTTLFVLGWICLCALYTGASVLSYILVRWITFGGTLWIWMPIIWVSSLQCCLISTPSHLAWVLLTFKVWTAALYIVTAFGLLMVVLRYFIDLPWMILTHSKRSLNRSR